MSLFPSRNRQADDVYDDGVAWGHEVKADTSRNGVVDDGNIAWPERVVEARRQWLEARAEDFEKTDKRTYVDRATGTEYLREHGAPLLAVGTEAVRGIVAFFVEDGRLVFLRRADVPQELLTYHGPIVAREIPTPSLRRGPAIH